MSGELNVTSLTRLAMSRVEVGHLLADQRVDLNDQHVLGIGRAEEWVQHRIAEIATVPIRHAVNFDRAEQRRQTGRRHDGFGGQFLPRENMQPAGLHISGGDINLPRIGAQSFEIDETLDEILERIDVERVERGWRQILGPGRDPVERPANPHSAAARTAGRSPRAARRADRHRGWRRARNRRAACALRRVRRA